jgi:hypothetical protein
MVSSLMLVDCQLGQKNLYVRYMVHHVRHDCSLFIFYSQGEGGPLLFIIEQKILLFGLNQRKMSRP